jgi:serine/threonine protein kinase
LSEFTLPITLGNCTLLEKLGEGGLANVYLGLENDKPYAIKILKAERNENEKVIQNFIREAKIGSQIRHPYLSKTIDQGKVGEHYYLVLDLVFGINVFEIIQHFQSIDKRIPVSITLYILKAACEALRYLHEKSVFDFSQSYLYHGDISPSNLMIDQSGFFKLMDLGSANQESELEITKSHFGKLQYLPPEFFTGQSPQQTFDIYAMGVVAFQMFFGEMPYKGETKTELIENIKHHDVSLPHCLELMKDKEEEKALQRFFIRALNKNPKKRFQNIKEFEKDLFLIKYSTQPIQNYLDAATFLRKYFSKKLFTTNENWQTLIHNYRQQDPSKTPKAPGEIESIVLPYTRRKHPRITVEEEGYQVSFQLGKNKEILKSTLLQLSRGGFLSTWNNDPPAINKAFSLELDLGKGTKINAEAEVRYVIPQKQQFFCGFEFINISESKQKMIDRIIQHQMDSQAKKEKLLTPFGIKHLHMYFPDKATLAKEVASNISHGRALVTSAVQFEHNTKVILHIRVKNDFHTVALNSTVVMCSQLEDGRYQLGLELEPHYETFEYLKRFSTTEMTDDLNP